MIAVISHDAGGAEILSSWLCQNEQPYCLVLSGPATSIFQRKLHNNEIISLERAIEMCDWVLCGTSWQSSLEKEAVIRAKAAQKKVITFLDHWVNYLGRFKLNGVITYPDEIWVGDLDAEKIAKQIFPELKISLILNPYLNEIIREIELIEEIPHNSNICSVLYVCEPISEFSRLVYGDENYLGYSENQALEFFFNNVNMLGCELSKLTIRPHPSENKSKYNWTKKLSPVETVISSTKSLAEQISEADIVIGCESMAMVVALWAKKRVISSIPIGGKTCQLPQDEIEHLQFLVNNNHGTLGD